MHSIYLIFGYTRTKGTADMPDEDCEWKSEIAVNKAFESKAAAERFIQYCRLYPSSAPIKKADVYVFECYSICRDDDYEMPKHPLPAPPFEVRLDPHL